MKRFVFAFFLKPSKVSHFLMLTGRLFQMGASAVTQSVERLSVSHMCEPELESRVLSCGNLAKFLYSTLPLFTQSYK